MVSVCWFSNRFENNLAPEEGFLSPEEKSNKVCFQTDRTIYLHIYFFGYILFSTSSSGLAVRMSCRFIFFYKFNCTDLGLQLGDPAPLIGLFFGCGLADILYILVPTWGGKGNRLNHRGSEPRSKPSI